jgi:hypothetical protein
MDAGIENLSPIEILEKVNAFYDTQWNHFLIYTAVLVGVVGVLVPILLQFYQTRMFKKEEDATSNRIKQQIKDMKSEIADALTLEFKHSQEETSIALASNQKQVDEEVVRLREDFAKLVDVAKKKLEKDISGAQAGLFHIQGNTQAKTYPPLAIESYISAACYDIIAEDEYHLRRVLVNISDCLKKVTKVAFQDESHFAGFSPMIETLEKIYTNNQYTDIIKDLKKEMTAAKERT